MPENVKARHEFPAAEDVSTSDTGTNVYAYVHQLGTEDLVVTARDSQGKPVLCESQIQDDNVVLVKKQGGNWTGGDKILLLGSKDD